MPELDWIVAIIILSSTLGLLALRAIRAWADFRVQRRSIDLLVRSVTELEQRSPEHRA